MDKGAHFFRCDFQVHTPRDINWQGHRPVTDDERREYARSFIKACREKGLGAVAITDHHDLGFFPYIREASKNELTSQGTPVPDEDRILVFPGMELTLAVPCQALLIFDENFPAEFFDPVVSRLGIVCSSSIDARHADTVRLDELNTLQKVCSLLDVLPFAKGRYILLPNVNDGGQFTLLRSGFHPEYRAMPCVGGYLDHPVQRLGKGNCSIVGGQNEDYGFKPLGVFPTSDNRAADFSKLGTNTAWVKWAEPTAEALRQACLARGTRIFHSPPKAPPIAISRIEVSNSKFLGPLQLELNPQFNCLIGGRGTGKSTILEYLRWALCDQPPSVDDPSENGNPEAKTEEANREHPQANRGTVTVDVLINGVRHTVRRKSDTQELLLKIGDQPMNPTSEDEIRGLLPIQGYSQKQLSGVGVRDGELTRFVESAGTRDALDQLTVDAKSTADAVRRAFQELEEKRNHAKSSEHLSLQLSSLEQQLNALKAVLKGLSPEDQRILDRNEQILAGNAAFDQWQQDAIVLADSVQRALRALEPLPHRQPAGRSQLLGEQIARAEQMVVEVFQKARSLIEEAGRSASSSCVEWTRFQDAKGIWAAASRDHEAKFKEVQGRLGEQRQTLELIASMEEQISQTKRQIAETAAVAAGLEQAFSEYGQVRREWEQKFAGRAQLLEERCALLSELSAGWIKASLKRGVMGQRLSELLSRHMQGSRIHSLSEKLEKLSHSITNAHNPMAYWTSVLAEVDALSLKGATEEPNEADSPLMEAAGFNPNDLQKIGRKIDRQAWLELSLIELEDWPVFEYRQREGDYIPFADASAGQQATVLLRVLLNQDGPPLVIDQPEDDLDNQVIYEVAEHVGQAKQRRQIIFTSHNANLVVNGDADLVVAFGYRTLGEHSGGEIKAEGAIDIKEVRDVITAVMEGGEKAFQLRKAKYGF